MITVPFHTLLIEQILGLYLVIVSLIMIARGAYYQDLIKRVGTNSGWILVGASFSLIFGLIMLVIHNIWEWDYEILVTLIAWLIVIKSILWLAFPENMLGIAQRVYSGSSYYLIMVLVGLLGVFMLAHGFQAFNGNFHVMNW
ncbi:Integral membrane protein (PIN domain superfamily) [Legionella quinlivanii]|uniref:Integral membrane protein (PIN domain superfamily) n=1 Tax=Legionella quinlivanii TaxID=45073 RepID=A0A0W0XNA3_9GAMM|nr:MULTISPECIES: hypothetical protein [Legionella]KTD46090.1 Integral membrane protein (PIN domain superfamily) [Legionella quinlivanii]MCE3043385.1 hypothetical protein [Legionella sp. 16cNR16C]MCW8451220.1 hypothetical protein [Legionella quinlivanii]RAP35998.1 hypothetical protein B1207_10520 [Legionella quinlivanii]SEG28878.1 hypothetical protein SAMN02746093_02432 [Legionella quinlivanii DSM 21216]